VVLAAQEEARRARHAEVGTEHLLLGFVHEPECLAVKAIESFGITRDALVEALEPCLGAPQAEVPATFLLAATHRRFFAPKVALRAIFSGKKPLGGPKCGPDLSGDAFGVREHALVGNSKHAFALCGEPIVAAEITLPVSRAEVVLAALDLDDHP
jgi:hypothetical protein